MKLLLLTLSFLVAINTYANDVFELNELTVDYRSYSTLNDRAYNFLTYPDAPKDGLNLTLSVNVLRYLYMIPTVEGITTKDQYRGVGLSLSMGVQLTDFLDVGLYHHSQHALDRNFTVMDHFAVEDAVQVKLYLYRKGKRESLF